MNQAPTLSSTMQAFDDHTVRNNRVALVVVVVCLCEEETAEQSVWICFVDKGGKSAEVLSVCGV